LDKGIIKKMISNKVYHFKELASTNEFAKGILKEAPEWTVVIADQQKEGKGRLGKKWYSPPGGLWFSVILKPQNPLIFPLIAGVAVCESMSELGIRARVKWPNDILINGKKVAGILTEFVDGNVILGMGINLNIQEFPEDIKSTATSLFLEKGKPCDKKKVLNLVLTKIEEKYKLVGRQNFEPLLEEWRSYSVTFGKKILVNTPTGVLRGEMIDIDLDGALLLKLPSGNIEKIFAGECTLTQDLNHRLHEGQRDSSPSLRSGSE